MAKVGDVRDVPAGSENSAEFDELARFAVAEHNTKQNAVLEFVGVVSVKKQVVAGTLYFLTLEATDGGEKKLYEAKVWVKPWEKFKELQEFKELGPFGAVRDVPLDSENSAEFDELARFAVAEHNTKQNAVLEFVGVVSVKEQVVAGTVYFLTLEATDGGEKKLYEAKVWVKPWEKFKELQEFKELGPVQDD